MNVPPPSRGVAPMPRNSRTLTAPSGCIGAPMFTASDLRLGAMTRGTTLPAGDVVNGNVTPGTYTAATNILVAGARPTLSTSAYRDALVRTVREVMGSNAGVDLSSVTVTVGAQQTLSRGLLASDAPGWWVNLSAVIAVANPVTVENINRAIARAFFQSATLSRVDDRYSMPGDGGPLLARLQAGNACSGGEDLSAVYARACTRFTPYQGMSIAALGQGAQPTTPASSTPTSPGTPSTTVRAAQQALVGNTCPTAQKFYLRPTATFDQVGREYPAGTSITILAPTGLRNTAGTLDLYQIRVNSNQATGYAALSASDAARCNGSSSGGSSSSRSSGGTPAATPGLATISSTGLSTTTKVGLAILGAALIGGGFYAYSELSGDAPAEGAERESTFDYRP